MSLKVYGHQWKQAVVVPYTFADFTTAVAEAIAQLPPLSTVTGGQVDVDVATDAGTSFVADIGDADDPNRYSSTPINLQALGTTALTVTGFQNLLPTDVIATPTIVGAAATAGNGRIILEYVVEGKANEVSR